MLQDMLIFRVQVVSEKSLMQLLCQATKIKDNIKLLFE